MATCSNNRLFRRGRPNRAARARALSHPRHPRSSFLPFENIRVHLCPFMVRPNRLDAELRRTDKRTVSESIDPKEGTRDSSLAGSSNPPHAPCHRTIAQRTVQPIVRNRKTMRIYLIGMLSGVMLASAFAYGFALPANSDYWRWEMWNRGGAAWTMDMRTGQRGWKWLVEPIPDTPRKRPVLAPSSQTSLHTEQL